MTNLGKIPPFSFQLNLIYWQIFSVLLLIWSRIHSFFPPLSPVSSLELRAPSPLTLPFPGFQASPLLLCLLTWHHAEQHLPRNEDKMCLSSAWILCRFALVSRVKVEFPTLAYETWHAVAPAFPALPISYTLCFALHAPQPHRLFLERAELFPASYSFSLLRIFFLLLAPRVAGVLPFRSWFKG